MDQEIQSLAHTVGVQVPRCVDSEGRRQVLYGRLRQHWRGPPELARQKVYGGGGHLVADHVHMLLSIPPSMRWPKSSAFSKGRAGSTSPDVSRPATKLLGPALLARGYYVSTVGRDEASIREYIQKQRDEISASTS